MQFINEMVTVMETTKKALESAYAQLLPSYVHCSDSVEKLQDLMEDINEKVANVKDMMDILTETPEDPDVDDLMEELDKDIARDQEKGVELPKVPETALPSVPSAIKTGEVKTEDDDLEAMLENLCIV